MRHSGKLNVDSVPIFFSSHGLPLHPQPSTVDLLLPSSSESSTTPPPSTSLPPLSTLSQSLSSLSSQLDQITSFVNSINPSTASPKDIEIGKYLLEAVGRWKSEASSSSSAAAGAGKEKKDGEEEEEGDQGVKNGLQEVLSLSYLSALVRSQVELSGRLNLLT